MSITDASMGPQVAPPSQIKPRQASANIMVPPDLSQGIPVSASSLSANTLERDTDVIVQKIKDLPAAEPLTGKDQKQISHLMEVQESSANAVQLAAAHAAMTNGDYTGAKERFDRVLTRDPDNASALAGKAYILQQGGQYKQAVALEHQILQRNPDDLTAQANLASALAAWGAPDAFTELTQLVVVKPNLGAAHAGLAKLLSTQDEIGAAIEQQQRALEIEPQNNVYRLSLAIFYDRAGQKENALPLYRQVLATRSNPDANVLPLTWTAIEQRINYLAEK